MPFAVEVINKFRIDASVIELVGYPPLLFIPPEADVSLKNELATLAGYFKAEMGFDRLQFDDTMYDEVDYMGFLLLSWAMDRVEHEDHFPSRVVGGGIFVEYEDGYELDWVWIHPFFRNRGLLKKAWKEFEHRFGAFTVSPPWSPSMKAFLAKRKTVHTSP